MFVFYRLNDVATTVATFFINLNIKKMEKKGTNDFREIWIPMILIYAAIAIAINLVT
jgi:hypothetical protein